MTDITHKRLGRFPKSLNLIPSGIDKIIRKNIRLRVVWNLLQSDITYMEAISDIKIGKLPWKFEINPLRHWQYIKKNM